METESQIQCEIKVCRICANSTNYLHSIEELFENIPYSTIIQVMCPVRIERSDLLPKFICFDCEGILLRAYKLREICMDNDRIFRSELKFKKQISTEFSHAVIKTEPVDETLQDVSIMSNQNDFELLEEVATPQKSKRGPGRPPKPVQIPQIVNPPPTSKRRLSLSEAPAVKKTRNKTIEEFFTQVSDYLSKKDASMEEPEGEETETTESVGKFKCEEENCKYSQDNLNMVKLHDKFDHSHALRQPSKHAILDVKINEFSEIPLRPFGRLRNKDGSDFDAPSTNLFCKLCINEGRIVHIDEERFMKHLVDKHLDLGSETDPVESVVELPKPAETEKETKKAEYKYEYTKKGHRVLVRGRHRLYAKKLPPKVEIPNVQKFHCALKIESDKDKKCPGEIEVSWAERQLKVITKCHSRKNSS